MAKQFNRALKKGYDVKTIGAVTVNVTEFDPSGFIKECFGTTVPTAASAGFAKGAIFTDTDVAGGTSGSYVNIGTTSSSNFSLIGAPAGTFTDLTATGNTTLGNAVSDTVVTNGVLYVRGSMSTVQSTPTAKTISSTLTVADLVPGIITINQGGGATSAQQLPNGTDLDTGFAGFAANDSYDFSIINISTVAAEDATISVNTGVTIVGNLNIPSNAAAGDVSFARFRLRKTGTATWVCYRIG